MSPRQTSTRAAFVAAVLLAGSLIAYGLLAPDPSAGCVTLPGFLAGVFIATLIAAAKGNAHAVDLLTILMLASLINFFCYFGLTYVVLSLWSRMQKD
jgi:hypothetical protein